MAKRNAASLLEQIFPGNSELAARMRALDWSKTPVGTPDRWPEHLRVALGICLTSRFPLHLWWGPTMTLFYNDAYVSFLGRAKHPAALGRSGREAWAEIWPTIGPIIDEVRATGEASWSEDMLMFFDRALPREEVYITFSFSPILGPEGTVDGLFCASNESTEKLVGARRLETLRRLGIRASEVQSVEQACAAAAHLLSKNPHDMPFAAIYVLDGSRATLSGTAGLGAHHPLPSSIAFEDEEPGAWSALGRVLRGQAREQVVDLEPLSAFPGGPWPEPTSQALVVPIGGTAHEQLAGVLVVGLGPRRVLDGPYRSFVHLVAGHIGTGLAEAQAYEAERRRAESLAALDRAKTAFFSNVSHEFRTPLTLILGPLHDALAMLPEPARPTVGALLQMADRNAQRMQKLVNGLLDFSRIEAGRLKAVFEPTDLLTLTAELVGNFRSAIERAHLKLAVEFEPIFEPVYVDWDMWEQIVLNLLSNAFKFTLAGSITVSLRQEGEHVVFSVADTGVGIAPDDLPRLFERFHRIEGVRARTHEGSGIGLALVQELVRLHGGEIRVDSELGTGTRFEVLLCVGSDHLPAEKVGPFRALQTRSTRASEFVGEALSWLPSGNGAPSVQRLAPIAFRPDEELGARILVVEDNADMRDYLTRLLGERWSIDTASDGEKALDLLRGASYDLVLTDVMMPALDGFGLLRAIRNDPQLQPVPVIMLSARAGEESRIEGLERGADDYLEKPFSRKEVVARVETQLKMASLRLSAESRRAMGKVDEARARIREPLQKVIGVIEELRRRDGTSLDLEAIERQLVQALKSVDDLFVNAPAPPSPAC
jgi:signal transduction histidine kinase/DNA-binding response OmpR family regulator